MTEQFDNKIDVHTWLKENKLDYLWELFQSKSIEIEELTDFNNKDLKEFASDTLNLDVLSKKRFVAAINKIKQQNEIPQTVMVTVEENEALTKLYERFDEISKQRLLIEQALNKSDANIDSHYTKCINNINILFNEIKKVFISRKDELLQQIDDITKNKHNTLNEQLNTLQNQYIPLINKGLSQYEAYANNKSQRLNILDVVNDIIAFDNNVITTTDLIIPPRVKFNMDNTMKLGNKFMNCLQIDDGDRPLPPTLNIIKVDSRFISIEYDIKKKYYQNINKPITRICIEYAILKHDEKLWKDDWKFAEDNIHSEIGPGFFTMSKENTTSTTTTTSEHTKESNMNNSNTFDFSTNESNTSLENDTQKTSNKATYQWSFDSDNKQEKEQTQNKTNFSWSFGTGNNNDSKGWSFDESNNNNTFSWNTSENSKSNKATHECVHCNREFATGNELAGHISGAHTIKSKSVKRAVLNKFQSKHEKFSYSIDNNFSKLFNFESVNKPEPAVASQIKLINISSIPSYDTLKWFKEEVKIFRKKKYDKQYKIKENIKDNKTYVIRVSLLNSSGWGDYAKQLYIVKTPKSIIESKILTIEEQINLKNTVDSQTNYEFKKWKLLYRASKHSFHSKAFFKKCDSKKNTVCIINVKGTDNVFGGFTALPWKKAMHYNINSIKTDSNPLVDYSAFVYSLRNKDNKMFSQIKVFNCAGPWGSWGSTAGQGVIGYEWNKFLMFGERGSAFYCVDNCNKNKGSSASIQACNSFSNLGINKLNGTKHNFYVKDIEVFQLISKRKEKRKQNKNKLSFGSNRSQSSWTWNSNNNQSTNNSGWGNNTSNNNSGFGSGWGSSTNTNSFAF